MQLNEQFQETGLFPLDLGQAHVQIVQGMYLSDSGFPVREYAAKIPLRLCGKKLKRVFQKCYNPTILRIFSRKAW